MSDLTKVATMIAICFAVFTIHTNLAELRQGAEVAAARASEIADKAEVTMDKVIDNRFFEGQPQPKPDPTPNLDVKKVEEKQKQKTYQYLEVQVFDGCPPCARFKAEMVEELKKVGWPIKFVDHKGGPRGAPIFTIYELNSNRSYSWNGYTSRKTFIEKFNRGSKWLADQRAREENEAKGKPNAENSSRVSHADYSRVETQTCTTRKGRTT